MATDSDSSWDDEDVMHDEENDDHQQVTAQWVLLPPAEPTPEQGRDFVPAARDSTACVFHNGHIYVYGGYCDSPRAGEVTYDDLWRARPVTAEESSGVPARSPSRPTPTTSMAASAAGFDGQEYATPASRWAAADCVHWELLRGPPSSPFRPAGRWGHSMCAPRGCNALVVIGGNAETDPLVAFDLQTHMWTLVRLAPGGGGGSHRPRDGTVSFDFDEYMNTTLGDTAAGRTAQEVQEEATQLTRRYLHSAITIPASVLRTSLGHAAMDDCDVVVLFGGLASSEECRDDVCVVGPFRQCDGVESVLALQAATATTIGEAPCARFGHGATFANASMFVHGGTNAADGNVNLCDVFELSLETWAWTRIETSTAPPDGRMLYTSFTDTDLGMWCILGGRLYDVETPPLDMLLFDLEAKEWHIIASQSGPYPRTAVSMGAVAVPGAQDPDAELGDFVAFCFGGEFEGYTNETLLLRVAPQDRVNMLRLRASTSTQSQSGGEELSPVDPASAGIADSEDGRRSTQLASSLPPQSLRSSTASAGFAEMTRSSGTAARGGGSSQQAAVAPAPPTPARVVSVGSSSSAPPTRPSGTPQRSVATSTNPTQPPEVVAVGSRQVSSESVGGGGLRAGRMTSSPVLPTNRRHAAEPGGAGGVEAALYTMSAALQSLGRDMNSRFFELERRLEETNRRVDSVRVDVQRVREDVSAQYLSSVVGQRHGGTLPPRASFSS